MAATVPGFTSVPYTIQKKRACLSFSWANRTYLQSHCPELGYVPLSDVWIMPVNILPLKPDLGIVFPQSYGGWMNWVVTKEWELDMGEATSNKAITVGLYYCILSLSFPLNIIYLFSLYKGFQVGISHLWGWGGWR